MRKLKVHSIIVVGTHHISFVVLLIKNKEQWWEEGEVVYSVSFSSLGHACTKPIRMLGDGLMKGTAPKAIFNSNFWWKTSAFKKVWEGRPNKRRDYVKKKQNQKNPRDSAKVLQLR